MGQLFQRVEVTGYGIESSAQEVGYRRGGCQRTLAAVRRKSAMVISLLIILVLTLVVSPAWGERDPLLEVLILKGTLTQREADEIQQEARQLQKERAGEINPMGGMRT